MEIQKGLKVEVNFISESRTEFSGTVFKGIGVVDLIEDDRVFGKLLNGTPFMCSISDVSPYVENLSPDEASFQECYLTAGGKQIELEKEDGAYTHSKSQMAWDIWQAKAVALAISNKIVIGTQVKIINPDDTAEYEVEAGDKGVVVWVGDFGTIFGVCIPVKSDVWSFEPCQFEVISNEAPNQASAVPEGFVMLSIEDVERACRCLDEHAIYITYKASDALENISKAMIEAQDQMNLTKFDGYVPMQSRGEEPSND